jgi:multiple antibiotic resistance protein
MISDIIAFLVMLNPFALFLYLQPIMKELDAKTFRKVLFKASLISFIIYLIFLYVGEIIFKNFLQIHFESFRIFGGIIIFSFAYIFIVKGQKALIHMKGDLDDLASEIALPFMVGAGTISLSILLGRNFDLVMSSFMLIFIMSLNFIFIMLLKKLREQIEKKKFRVAFDKNMEILLRLNGFFVGAIGVDMVITGITNLFF